MTELYGLPGDVVEQLCGVFRQYPQIETVILYGSRAKGGYRLGSDIDLTIEGQGLDLSLLLAVEEEIDDLLLPWMVDLSLFDQIDNVSLVEHIRRLGKPFFTRSQDQ